MAKVDKKALAALRRTAKGAHGRLKDREPSQMGRLPGGLSQCVGKIFECSVSMTKQNSIQFRFRFAVIEDSINSGSFELVGVKASQVYSIFDSDGASKEDRLGWFYEDLMRLGHHDAIQGCDTEEDVITEIFLKMEGDHFIFNTGTKENNGYYPVYLEGPVPDDYVPPTQEEDLKGKKKAKKSDEPEPDDEPDEPAESKVSESPFAVGDVVQVEYDGDPFSGTIQELTDTCAVIRFDDDGSEDEIPFDQIEYAEKGTDISVGDIVFCSKLRGEDKRAQILELDEANDTVTIQRCSTGRKMSKTFSLADFSFDE